MIGNSSASQPEGGLMGKEISTSVKTFLGVFIILLAIIGVIGNTIVITVLRIKNIFTRKATSLILTSLAAVDLLGSMVDIPLAFSIMVASLPDEQLYRLSLAKVVIGPLFFLGYITCFFLLSFDRNDALRKTSNRPALLTAKRILMVLTLSLTFGVAMSLLFVFKSENPSPLIPRKMEPRLLTLTRGGLFLAFVIAVSSNIYFYLKIKRLIRDHSENAAVGFSQVQRGNWQVKERKVSWTVIQLILVVCLSYIPYTVTSIIFMNANIVDIRLLNAVAICRSLTYLKYAVNAFIFTRLDGKFLRVFVDILRRFHSNKRRIVAKSPSRRVHSKKKEEHSDAENVGGITERLEAIANAKEVLNEKASGHEIRELVTVKVREINLAENDVRVAKPDEFPLPTILITSPQGKSTVILKDKKHRNWRNWTNKRNLRRSRCRKSAKGKSEVEA